MFRARKQQFNSKRCVYVFTEVGKNINQDKSLSLKRYVEGYHKYVNSLKLQQAQSETKDNTQRRDRKIKGMRVHLYYLGRIHIYRHFGLSLWRVSQ